MMLNIIRLITLFIRIFSICIIINVLANNKQYITKWCCYNINNAFFKNIKSKTKISNHEEGIKYLQQCDFIIYQHILPQTSEFFNTECILKYKKGARIADAFF